MDTHRQPGSVVLMSRPLRLLSLLSLALLLTGLASCGGGGGGSTVSAGGSVPVLHLLHPDTPIVLGADMDGLRRSPYYATARDLTSTLSDSERRDFDTLFQLLDRADHFVVGFDPFGEGADDTLIALRGAFEPSHLDVFTEFTEREAFRNHELRGRGSEWAVVGLLALVFVLIGLALNLMLWRLVLRPVSRLSAISTWPRPRSAARARNIAPSSSASRSRSAAAMAAARSDAASFWASASAAARARWAASWAAPRIASRSCAKPARVRSISASAAAASARFASASASVRWAVARRSSIMAATGRQK